VATFAVTGGNLSIPHILDAPDLSFAGTPFPAAAKGDSCAFMRIFATHERKTNEKKADGTMSLRRADRGRNWRLMTNMREHISPTDMCDVAPDIGDQGE
jgi:hypothetical protein